MPEYDSVGPEEWMNQLDEGDIVKALERARELDPNERRRLVSDPGELLDDLGAPRGVEIKLLERSLQDFDMPIGFKIPGIPEHGRPDAFICVDICVWVPRPWGFRRICRRFCIRV